MKYQTFDGELPIWQESFDQPIIQGFRGIGREFSDEIEIYAIPIETVDLTNQIRLFMNFYKMFGCPHRKFGILLPWTMGQTTITRSPIFVSIATEVRSSAVSDLWSPISGYRLLFLWNCSKWSAHVDKYTIAYPTSKSRWNASTLHNARVYPIIGESYESLMKWEQALKHWYQS